VNLKKKMREKLMRWHEIIDIWFFIMNVRKKFVKAVKKRLASNVRFKGLKGKEKIQMH